MTGTEPVAGDMSWSDIPTCAEAGLPIESYQLPRTAWLPADTSEEEQAFYVDLLRKVTETPEWADYITATSQTSDFLAGDDLAKFIDTSEASAVKVFEAEGWLVN